MVAKHLKIRRNKNNNKRQHNTTKMARKWRVLAVNSLLLPYLHETLTWKNLTLVEKGYLRLDKPPRRSLPSYHVNAMRDFMDRQVIPAKRVTPGVPHLHVNKPLTLGRTCKVILPPWYKGRGDDGSISKRFCLQWKAFDILYKMGYVLLVVALFEVCHVTKHGRHLGFYQELESKWKQWELLIFLRLTCKMTHK